MNHLRKGLILLLAITFAVSAAVSRAEDAAYRYYIDISQISLADLDTLFRDLESDLGKLDGDPLVIVLHGDEAGAFLRSNYVDNKPLVDAAALLDAHGVIDLKMCATWMRDHAVTGRDIPPFIETVPYGPEEVRRLEKAGYLSAAKVKL
jgi:hypothetical protein